MKSMSFRLLSKLFLCALIGYGYHVVIIYDSIAEMGIISYAAIYSDMFCCFAEIRLA